MDRVTGTGSWDWLETVAPQERKESKGWAGRDGPLLLGLKVKGAPGGSSRNLARKLRQSRKKSAETIPDSLCSRQRERWARHSGSLPVPPQLRDDCILSSKLSSQELAGTVGQRSGKELSSLLGPSLSLSYQLGLSCLALQWLQ